MHRTAPARSHITEDRATIRVHREVSGRHGMTAIERRAWMRRRDDPNP
jgi:hypothetical protein